MKIELNTLGSIGLILLAISSLASLIFNIVVYFYG